MTARITGAVVVIPTNPCSLPYYSSLSSLIATNEASQSFCTLEFDVVAPNTTSTLVDRATTTITITSTSTSTTTPVETTTEVDSTFATVTAALVTKTATTTTTSTEIDTGAETETKTATTTSTTSVCATTRFPATLKKRHSKGTECAGGKASRSRPSHPKQTWYWQGSSGFHPDGPFHSHTDGAGSGHGYGHNFGHSADEDNNYGDDGNFRDESDSIHGGVDESGYAGIDHSGNKPAYGTRPNGGNRFEPGYDSSYTDSGGLDPVYNPYFTTEATKPSFQSTTRTSTESSFQSFTRTSTKSSFQSLTHTNTKTESDQFTLDPTICSCIATTITETTTTTGNTATSTTIEITTETSPTSTYTTTTTITGTTTTTPTVTTTAEVTDSTTSTTTTTLTATTTSSATATQTVADGTFYSGATAPGGDGCMCTYSVTCVTAASYRYTRIALLATDFNQCVDVCNHDSDCLSAVFDDTNTCYIYNNAMADESLGGYADRLDVANQENCALPAGSPGCN